MANPDPSIKSPGPADLAAESILLVNTICEYAGNDGCGNVVISGAGWKEIEAVMDRVEACALPDFQMTKEAEAAEAELRG